METYALTLEALADPTRRQIFESLRHGPRSVSEIAGPLPVSRPAVSQHLRVLEKAALVRVQPAGRRRIYTIDRNGLAALRGYVDSYWDDVLSAFGEAAVAAAHDATNEETT